MIQLAMDFPRRTALGRADFFVSDCNSAALGWVERWPDWPGRALVLYGPKGSGKTHLAQLWRERAGATVIAGDALRTETVPAVVAAGPAVALDDAGRAPEVALLHLYNSCREGGVGLLIVMPTAPAAAPIALADLASRLRAAPTVGIAAPDEVLLAAVLVKHFADRQLRVEPELIAYLIPRLERSFAAAGLVAERLDRLAQDGPRPITVPLARQALAAIAAQPSSDFGVA